MHPLQQHFAATGGNLHACDKHIDYKSRKSVGSISCKSRYQQKETKRNSKRDLSEGHGDFKDNVNTISFPSVLRRRLSIEGTIPAINIEI
jgi:hypothetical protein